ncbi:MAG: hypothetical protein GEV03_23735 [Streptosporangiales bacterium]|nr:hypothetical protein [Streptosporangiales bacterium]
MSTVGRRLRDLRDALSAGDGGERGSSARGSGTSPGPDTFPRWLRTRSDAELHALLAARPDLMHPVPSDLAALANRAAGQASVVRALDQLDRFTLQVLEALLALPEPVGYDELRAALDVSPPGPADGEMSEVESVDVEPPLRRALDRLYRLALIWGDDQEIRPVGTVRHVITDPAGLGPPAAVAFNGYPADRMADLLVDLGHPPVDGGDGAGGTGGADPWEVLAADLADPGRLAELVESAGPGAAAALERLAWGPPIGRVEDARRTVRLASAESPMEHLLARGLLAAADERTVVLPREVALHLRGGRVFRSVEPEPPSLHIRPHDLELVDRTAGGQAFGATRAVEGLLELWGVDPPGVLRSGGLGVRDLRRAARALDVEEWMAALYAETAWVAGLLGASGAVDGEWLPTQTYDLWRTRPVEQRWATLVEAWLETTRVPGLVGERDDRGRVLNALGYGLDRGAAPGVREQTLRVLAEAPPGSAADTESVRARLAWLRPRHTGPIWARMVGWTLQEAEAFGVTGLGALSTPGRRLVDAGGGSDGAADAVVPLLPQQLDHMLLQADLTAVAPGPLTQELGRELALAADVESTGGATVYRFTEPSVRRALDAGRTAGELIEFLERHSRTPMPQPLRYLVEDVARRHGRIRVGIASAYLRCDDPATLTELLADRRAVSLRLFRLAPTVLASRASRDTLLDGLRTLGYAPMAESPDGAVQVTRPDARRTQRQPARPRPPAAPTPPNPSVIDAAVHALRAGDKAMGSVAGSVVDGTEMGGAGGEPPRTSTAAAMDALQEAAADGRRVWIGYLDTQGRPSSRIVDPVQVEGGYLTAFDTTRASVHRFALHRITGVAGVEDGAP